MRQVVVRCASLQILVLACFLNETGHANDNQGGPILAKEVIQAWQDRQDRARSFVISLKGTVHQKIDKSILARQTGQDLRKGKQPPDDVVFPVTARFVLDPTGRSRFEYESKVWSAKDGDFVPNLATVVFDGDTDTVFSPPGVLGFPNAHIRKPTKLHLARHAQNFPVRMIYRPFDSALGDFDPAKMELTSEEGVVEGQSCHILEQGKHTVWVDPTKEFLPVRYYDIQNGTTRRSIEISYSKDDQLGWVPASWKDVYPFNPVADSTELTVTEYSINESIPDETFVLIFPPGTWVHNHVTKEEYLLRDGDERRRVREGEYTGENYQQLLNTDGPVRTGRFRTLVVVNFVMLALLVGFGFYYYYRSRRRTA